MVNPRYLHLTFRFLPFLKQEQRDKGDSLGDIVVEKWDRPCQLSRR